MSSLQKAQPVRLPAALSSDGIVGEKRLSVRLKRRPTRGCRPQTLVGETEGGMMETARTRPHPGWQRGVRRNRSRLHDGTGSVACSTAGRLLAKPFEMGEREFGRVSAG